ncbi:MAG: DUF58 domain-containing protein [Lachnospiraceae bacterium]|nr:DUF58 domain-containing protein [Lachnospiraceae bacterium]MDY4165151.1 DUF58 domain-containing protein [Lachnospiraceae bacterium]
MKIHLKIPRIIIYALWIIVLLVLYDYFRVWFLMVALLIALAGGAIDILLLYLMAGQTDVTLETDTDTAEKGDDVPVYIHIDHYSFIPSAEIKVTLNSRNEFYGSGQDTEIMYPLYSAEDFHEELPVTFTMLGTYTFSLKKAQVRDLFGFAEVRVPLDSTAEISVFPKPVEIEDEKLGSLESQMTEADESTARGNDTTDISEIREYAPGDRPRDIHWKASAKRDDLMVKQREGRSDQMLFVLLWCGDTAAETENNLTECYSLLKELVAEKTNVTLLWWSEPEYTFHQKKILYADDIDEAYREIYMTQINTEADPAELMESINPQVTGYVQI